MARKKTRDSVRNARIHKLMLKIWRWGVIPELIKDMILYLINKWFIIGVLAIITDDKGRILLFHHTYMRDNPWGVPGGAAKDEDLEKALHREIFEESRFKIDIHHNIGVVQWGRRKVDFLFACSIKSGEFTPSVEVSKHQYFYLNELSKVSPHHHIILDRMAHSTKTWPQINTSIESFFLSLSVMNEKKRSLSVGSTRLPTV